MSAAQVAQWCGVDRSWVYAHADELGAARLGEGERPRLRFDPSEVSARIDTIGAPSLPLGLDRCRLPAMPAATRFHADTELLSSGKQERPGGAQTPPARRRELSFGAMISLEARRSAVATWRSRLPCSGAPGPGGDRVARRSEGQVLERRWKSGRGYALRFRAYGERQYLTLGLETEGWTRKRAEEELANVMADVRRGLWVPPTRAEAAAERGEADGCRPSAQFARA